MNSTNKDNEFQIYEVDLTQKGNIEVTHYLSDSNTVDPLLEGSNVITAEVLDILRLLLDLRMLWIHTSQLDCLKETRSSVFSPLDGSVRQRQRHTIRINLLTSSGIYFLEFICGENLIEKLLKLD